MFWPIYDSCVRLYNNLQAIPKGVVLIDPDKL